MTGPVASPPPLPEPPPVERLVLRPGFGRTWQGLWSFTWRSELTRRRWPMLMVTLLSIPLLTFFTIEPMQRLGGGFDWRQPPRQLVNEFRSEAGEFPGATRTKLAQIIGDEQGRVELPAPDGRDANPFTEAALDQAVEQAQASHARIAGRARSVLTPSQFEAFERFQARKLDEATAVIRSFNLRRLKPYFSWLLNFYLFLALPLYCLTACGSMIRDELQADTIGFLTTRPVGRARLFLAKYLCQMLWLQGMVALHGLLMLSVGAARHMPGLGPMLPLLLGTQVLAVFSWGALSALLGLISRRYLVLGIAYGLVVEFGLGRIPTNVNTLSMLRHFRGLLGHHPLLQQLYDLEPQNTGFVVAAVVIATAIFLALGATLWAHREYHHAAEMQK